MRLSERQERIVRYLERYPSQYVYIGESAGPHQPMMIDYSMQQVESSLARLVKRNLVIRFGYMYKLNFSYE